MNAFNRDKFEKLFRSSLLALFWLLAASGCSTVNVAEQRLVSKANMVFSDDPVFADGTVFHSLIEPGTAGSGGAQASGCTSCK